MQIKHVPAPTSQSPSFAAPTTDRAQIAVAELTLDREKHDLDGFLREMHTAVVSIALAKAGRGSGGLDVNLAVTSGGSGIVGA